MKHEREDYNKRVQCVDGSIPEDEPVFLLRGKDPTAESTIREWLKFKNAAGGLESEKSNRVLQHAARMADYYRSLHSQQNNE